VVRRPDSSTNGKEAEVLIRLSARTGSVKGGSLEGNPREKEKKKRATIKTNNTERERGKF